MILTVIGAPNSLQLCIAQIQLSNKAHESPRNFLLRFILLATFGLQAKAIVAQTVITEDFNDNSRSWWTGHDLGRAIIAEVKMEVISSSGATKDL
ncbi:MAG: hypothetical protein IPN95_27550 [Bacteroidetes bacterium]|nr:hypothetical protein [Bacteroidota bacterium]